MGKAVRKRARGAPEPGAPSPATRHPPRILFLTPFTFDFSRFEGHLSCAAAALRRNNMSARVWYGLRPCKVTGSWFHEAQSRKCYFTKLRLLQSDRNSIEKHSKVDGRLRSRELLQFLLLGKRAGGQPNQRCPFPSERRCFSGKFPRSTRVEKPREWKRI